MKTLPTFAPLDEKRIDDLLARASIAAEKLVAGKELLNADMKPESLAILIEHYVRLWESMSLAGQLCDAHVSVASNDSHLRSLASRVDSVGEALSTKTLFFTLTLASWTQEQLLAFGKALPVYAPWLRRIALSAPHRLSEAEERLINIKDRTGSDALQSIYHSLTNLWKYTISIDGEEKTLSQGELSPYILHPKREIRKQAIDAVAARYKEHTAPLEELYAAIARDWDAEHVTLRKYATPLDPRHRGNDISPEAFAALRVVVQKNKHLFQEYVQLKKQALGYEEFTRYDFSAPVPGKPQGQEYFLATQTVLSVFGRFAPWMQHAAKKVLEGGCVDAPPRQHKRSGACLYPMTPGNTPFMIVNHTGVFDDTYTLAHELGHAVHDILATKQHFLSFNPPLVLAETASQFSELLLLEHDVALYGEKAKVALLCYVLDEAMSALQTQMRYTEFERLAHDHIMADNPLSELHTLWSTCFSADFPAVDLPKESHSWLSIPHFFDSPFYCYSYSFGFLLTLVLWQEKLVDTKKAAQTLHTILSSGGSVPPEELLQKLGYDITQELFWEKGYDVLRNWLSELKTLL